jgi:hypothetical protein
MRRCTCPRETGAQGKGRKQVDPKKVIAEGLTELAQIDEVLARQAGTMAQKIARAIEAQTDRWLPMETDDVFSMLETGQFAIRLGAVKDVQEYIGQLANEAVTEWLQANKESGEVTALRERRAKLVTRLEVLRDMGEDAGLKLPEFVIPADPTKGKGGSSKGGGSKVSTSNLQFWRSKDGGTTKEKQPASQNTLGSLAFYQTKGLDENGNKVDDTKQKMSSAQLEALLVKNGITVDGSWSFTLANGVTIGADKVEQEAPAEADAPVEA